MSSYQMKSANKLNMAVRESLQEDNSDDDIDDEVFIRDGRNGFSVDLENSKKPLMAPRRKPLRNGNLYTEIHRAPPFRVTCAPVCYGLMALGALLGFIAIVVFIMKYMTSPYSVISFWTTPSKPIHPCSKLQVEDVWVKTFPKLLTESAFRLLDVNSDNVLDVVFGYGTGADGYQVPRFVCDIYFHGQKPCFGGVLALNGATGEELWRHWTDHEVFALNCNSDFDSDGVKDCLAGGRAGVFSLISGKDGSQIWKFGSQKAKNELMNVYTAQVVRDLDGDGIFDVLVMHGGDPLADPGSKFRLSGRLLLFSGKDGRVLQWIGTPDKQESYYSPQLLVHPDGTEYVLFGTGGETHPGGLHILSIDNLYKGSIEKSVTIYKDDHKGIMAPPVLVDIDGDGTEDIVMAMFNSTVIAFNGFTFEKMWNYSIPNSETYSTPAAGYFNSDSTPDFLIKYQIGPGFPLYYYASTTVLNGINGKPLLTKPITDTIGTQASGLTISMDGFGNDLFLYWLADCTGYKGEKNEYSFVKGSNVHELSRADFCKVRFKSNLYSQIYALNSISASPGFIVYDSSTRRDTEYNNSINTSAEAQEYLKSHPDLWDIYKQYTGKSLFSDVDEGVGVASGVMWPDTDAREYSETIPYPSYHNVRKHGKYATHPRPMNHQLWSMQDMKNYPFGDVYGNYDNQYPNIDERYPSYAFFGSRREERQASFQKRHVGAHDENGIQRLISTGTLAPPLKLSNESIDFVFATYWFYPSKAQAILPEDRDCIQARLSHEAERFDKRSKYFGMDHDGYEETITKECLDNSNHGLPDGTFESQSDYDPFNIHMGQMTVYRLRLTCACSDDKNCASVLPYERQRWAAYMGTKGTSYFNTMP